MSGLRIVLAWALWVLPIVVVPLSYTASRYAPFRGWRYFLYGLMTLTAFFLDLFSLSFRNDLVDALGCLTLVFIAFETLWYVRRVRAKNLFRIAMGGALLLLLYGYRGWLWSGPQSVLRIGENRPASGKSVADVLYIVKDYRTDAPFFSKREICLKENVPRTPFERRLDSYRTPSGYGRADFTYQWGTSHSGPKVDLVDGATVLWTLGVGL